MATTKLQVSGRRGANRTTAKTKPLWPDGRKFTMKLSAEEVLVAHELARKIAQPGQRLNLQDTLRISLANFAKLTLDGTVLKGE